MTWNFPLIGRTRMLTEAWQRLGVPTAFVQAPFLRSALERVFRLNKSEEPLPIVRPWPSCPRRLWPYLSESRLRAVIESRARGLHRQLERVLDIKQAAAIVVSPLWTPWLAALPFRTLIYDCIDAPEVHLPRAALAPLFKTWHAELVARADGAVATADLLATDLRRQRPTLPVTVIPNGVDADRFQALAAESPRPADLPQFGHPLVGFVGVMRGGATYEWLDWELIERTVQALPDYEFVFVGPYDPRGLASALTRLPNAHLLGWRPYAQIPAYMQAFTVAWVPFNQGNVGVSANPVKIYEYLALGKPVISTPVADSAAFGSLVQIGHDWAEITGLLRSTLTQPVADAPQRIAFARANSWEVRARAFSAFADGLASQTRSGAGTRSARGQTP